MKKNNVLEVRDLNIEARPFGAQPIPIVKDVSFDVQPGQVVALIGESGSGKTTIALSALGYTKPGLYFSGGEVLLQGEDMKKVSNERKRQLRGENVAYLAQSAAATFNPALKIGEQVTESAVIHGAMHQKEASDRATALYKALELPDPEKIGNRYPHQVSGGQLQRLMAAMALVTKPALLVLDEPTTALDVTTQIEVLKAFKTVIKNEGSAAIYVTHDLALVAQIADHIVVLYGGEVMEQGPASEVINNSSHKYTQKLMAAVRPTPKSSVNESFEKKNKEYAKALEVKNVTAGYGRNIDGTPKFTALHDVNLSVEKGKVVGIIGESGCGKSTLARVIAGLLPTFRGNVVFEGKKLPTYVSKRTRSDLQMVQFVFQMADTALNPKQRISEIIGRPLQFYRGIGGPKQRDEVCKILDLVELPSEFANRFPGELSGGQKQRVNLARALASKPAVLLCDEVTSALDTIVGANVIKLLRNLRDKTGVSIVFISHDLSTVANFADEIVVLHAGKVVEAGATERVLTPPFHPYTELLVSSVPELRVGWMEETSKTRNALAKIWGMER